MLADGALLGSLLIILSTRTVSVCEVDREEKGRRGEDRRRDKTIIHPSLEVVAERN